jgi:hypothetical protein
VAGSTPAPVLFGRVCEELGELLAVKTTDMIRYEDERFATVVGSWTGNDTPAFPLGEQIPVEGESVTAKLYRSGRPERVDDYNEVEGELAERLREYLDERPVDARTITVKIVEAAAARRTDWSRLKGLDVVSVIPRLQPSAAARLATRRPRPALRRPCATGRSTASGRWTAPGPTDRPTPGSPRSAR